MVPRLHLLRILLVMSAVCFVLFTGRVSAQESPGTVTAEDTVTDPENTAPNAIDDPVADAKEQKRQAAVATLIVLCVVCGIFLLLILFVVIWSKRMRRLVNEPLRQKHPGDPLWYLRKPDSNRTTETKPATDSED